MTSKQDKSKTDTERSDKRKSWWLKHKNEQHRQPDYVEPEKVEGSPKKKAKIVKAVENETMVKRGFALTKKVKNTSESEQSSSSEEESDDSDSEEINVKQKKENSVTKKGKAQVKEESSSESDSDSTDSSSEDSDSGTTEPKIEITKSSKKAEKSKNVKEIKTKSVDKPTSSPKKVEKSKKVKETDTKSVNKPSSSPKKVEKNPSEKKQTVAKKSKSKEKHYVVFIGNLAYFATNDDITEHFNDIGGIKDIRLLTHQDTGKSKGCAFVEFNNERSHMNALTLHHSKMLGRQINVEFTSAGRKTENRTKALKKKNEQSARFKRSVQLNF